MVDLRGRQGVFKTIIAASLHDLEFDADEVVRWYPLGAGQGIVLDPARAFGRPVVRHGGVPTEVIADAVAADGSAEAVARLYEIPLKEVRAAVAFQTRLAA